MDTDSFRLNIKIEDVYGDIANDAEKRFDTWNYVTERLLPIGKNKNVSELMKDELGGKIITESVWVNQKLKKQKKRKNHIKITLNV